MEFLSLEDSREARNNIISLNANIVWERWCFCDQASKNKRALCWVCNWPYWYRKHCTHRCPRAWSGEPETCFSFPIKQTKFIHQTWAFKAQSSKSYQSWSHSLPSSFSGPFQKQPHCTFFSSRLTEITLGSIIFLGWKPYAISCSCIRLSCIWWNRSIKSCGKRWEDEAWPGVHILIYWQPNLRIRPYQNSLAYKEIQVRKCCLCHKMKLGNIKEENIHVNKIGTR